MGRKIMRISKTLTYLEKRRLLNSNEIDRDILVAYGNFYLEAGMINDALDFFEKADFEEGLKKIQRVSLEEGDVFVFKRVNKILGMEILDEQWNEIGNRALELGKSLYAALAFEAAGNSERAKEVRREGGI